MKFKFLIPLLIMFLTGCDFRKPAHEEIITWFHENHLLLNELKEIGLENCSLRRFEPGMESYVKEFYSDPNEKDLNKKKRVYEILEKLDLDFVQYFRSHKDLKEFICMIIPYWRVGLSVGGRSVSIEYIPSLKTLEKLKEHGSVFTELDEKGWYIVETEHS